MFDSLADEIDAREQRLRLTQSQRFDGLKSAATSAHAVLTEALPFVHHVGLKKKMEDVLERLDIWGAHP